MRLPQDPTARVTGGMSAGHLAYQSAIELRVHGDSLRAREVAERAVAPHYLLVVDRTGTMPRLVVACELAAGWTIKEVEEPGNTYAEGQVVDQFPSAGTAIAERGAHFELRVSTGDPAGE